ncbi:MAG TPA: molecular chaperone HtpG, partial [Gammaproteobacteria bacterium]|nr:molecular chaperone HtpG [Gammaproteobacteria bacterium]
FYRHVTHDFSDPLTYSHNKVEGKREYTSLLYVPSIAPMDLWNREAPRGVKLYVQRVFITDQAAEFLPLYLRFVRGVVDSSDLALNVSREMLQQDPAISSMRSALTKRVLDMLSRLADKEPEKYATFWAQFGTTLKEGLAEDPGNLEKIASLLRFRTTRSDAEDRSLDDYIEDFKPGQDRIYYLISDSAQAAAASPHLEAFRERDIEVVLLSDRIDEWALQYLTEYQGKALRDVSRGELELPGSAEQPEVRAEPDKDQKDLLKRIKRVLRDRVDEVRASSRLTESAACIVLGDQDLGYQMKEMLKAAGQSLPETKPNLEVNLGHPLLKRIADEADDDRFGKLAGLVFDQAVLAEGRQLDDPARFVRSLNELLFDTTS